MNTKNTVPKPIDKVISLGVTALVGAHAIGATVPLQINKPELIEADLHDFIGNPDTPLIPGKQSKYATQKTAVSDAYAAARLAVKAARSYCLAALGVLKPILGQRWNAQWIAAGFIAPTLAVPRDPVPMLIRFRQYFNANAAQEVAVLNVTAARAQLRLTEIQQADLAVAQARDLLVVRKAERDESLARLRQRLSGLRTELELQLEEDDGRWYEFGFRRPIDGTQPAPVTGLMLTPGSAGVVLVSWAASRNADDYRVVWRPSSGGPSTQAGLFAARQCALTGLPSGLPIIVGVSARNDSGETGAEESAIVVP